MANINETFSFDADTSKLVAQIDRAIAEVKGLQGEYNKLAKEGKDVSDVNNRIASTTQRLNSLLQSEANTAKGLTAQTRAMAKANSELSTTQERVGKTAEKTISINKRTVGSLASVGRSAKTMAGFIGGAATALVGFNPLAGLAATAVDLLVTSLVDYFTASKDSTEATKELDAATKALIETFAAEKVEIDNVFNAALSDVSSKEQRLVAINKINQAYAPYLKNLLTEKSSLLEIVEAQEAATASSIERSVREGYTKEFEDFNKRYIEQLQRRVELTKLIEEQQTEVDRQNRSNGFVEGNVQFLLNDLLEKESKLRDEQNKLLEERDKLERKIKENVFDLSKAAGLTVTITDEGQQISGLLAAQKAEEARAQAALKSSSKQQQAASVLKGSLADLEAALSEVNKQIREQTKIGDSAKLGKLAEQYRGLKERIEEAKAELDALLNPKDPRAEIAATITINSQDAADELRAALAEAEAARVEEARQEAIKLLAVDKERLEAQSFLQKRVIEKRRQESIKSIQQTGKLTAKQAEDNAKAIEAIELDAANAREIIDNNTTRQLLENRLKIIELEKQAADLSQVELETLNKEVASIGLEMQQLGFKVETKQAEDAISKLGAKMKSIADELQTFSDLAFSFFNQQAANISAKYDEAVNKQRSTLDALLSNEESASVQAVAVERQRLEALEKERQNAKNREAIIIQAQIAANAALAIARAVAEGGGIGSALTVAAALASLVAGFAAAKQQASQAFYKGTEYVNLGKGERDGIDTVSAKLTKGEAVLPVDTNRDYRASVKAIYRRAIPAKVLNDFVESYKKGVLPKSLESAFSLPAYAKAHNIELSGSQFNDARILEALHGIALAQGSSTSSQAKDTIIFNENGFIRRTQKAIARKKQINNMHK